MKKIAIFTESMRMGGCEKALLALLNTLNQDKFSCTLYLQEPVGELLEEIPHWVRRKTIPMVKLPVHQLFFRRIKKEGIIAGINVIVNFILMKLTKKYYKQFYYRVKMLPSIEENYDLVISYTFLAQFCDWYVVNKTNAKKKIVWLHSDISQFNGIDELVCNLMYSKYDQIYGVSIACCEKFNEKFPNLKEKVSVFYNIISKDLIFKQAEIDNPIKDNFNGYKILTVGRLDKAKGQDLIPLTLKKILDDGYSVNWYLVGDGNLRGELDLLIKKYNLEDNLILLGSKKNPYPYLKECDLYVQPSRYEAFCLTVCEARCFNKPIIATNFTGITDQIINNETGFIVPVDSEEIYKKIRLILDNPELIEKFKKNLLLDQIDTTKEIHKIENIIDSEG